MNGQAIIVFLQSDCATEVPLLESVDCSIVCARHVHGIAANVDKNYDFSIGIVGLLAVVAVVNITISSLLTSGDAPFKPFTKLDHKMWIVW